MDQMLYALYDGNRKRLHICGILDTDWVREISWLLRVPYRLKNIGVTGNKTNTLNALNI
jgi:hypothetical protein